MSPHLERRYATLLRVYPRAYRSERGDELLGTLLDSARPQQRWPSARETAHLVLAGLRARSGTDTTLTSREVWARSLHLAVLALLLYRAATDLVLAIVWLVDSGAHPAPLRLARTETAAAALLLVAVPLVLRGRFLPALVPVLAAFTGRLFFGMESESLRAAFADPEQHVLYDWLAYGVSWQCFAALGGLVLLATALRPGRRRLSVGWTVALAPAVLLMVVPDAVNFSTTLSALSPVVKYVVVPAVITAGIPIVGMLWTRVDPSVPGACAWWLAAAGLHLLVITDLYTRPVHEFFFVSEDRFGYVRDRVTWLTVPLALLAALLLTRHAVRQWARH